MNTYTITYVNATDNGTPTGEVQFAEESARSSEDACEQFREFYGDDVILLDIQREAEYAAFATT